ncbi:MAG: hypothetical protein SXA11_19920 [Cyanobacteriota bacterium]|nr:hypothetical protein [Cyanobacteriota bacterium]
MVYEKKGVKKAAAALLISSTVTAGGLARACNTLEVFNPMALRRNETEIQELKTGLNSLIVVDSLPSSKISDSSSTTKTDNNTKETPPYPGDSNERWTTEA